MKESVRDQFDLTDRVAIITGGAGFLGRSHAEAIAEAGGVPVIWDIDEKSMQDVVRHIESSLGARCVGQVVDITREESVRSVLGSLLGDVKHVDILINNAADNPTVEGQGADNWQRVENFPLEMWERDISVGLTGAFLCSKAVGSRMAERGSGVILNISSDLGVIAPDQRIYRDPDRSGHEQPVKPVTYSIIKHGIIGLTKYLATYWAERNVRVNALAPGGVYNNQPEDFVQRLTDLIPMGRMAEKDEYKAAVVFLCSDASSYMTGATLVMDGGRSTW